jgi:hypothetical protein
MSTFKNIMSNQQRRTQDEMIDLVNYVIQSGVMTDQQADDYIELLNLMAEQNKQERTKIEEIALSTKIETIKTDLK